MPAAPLKILVLCTGNSCRSIMMEAALNHWGGGRIEAFSAGSKPTGAVHPQSLAVLRAHGLPVEGCRSKSWDEFAHASLDAVITVCDNAAGEVCPLFPGAPIKAHWGLPDPAHATGTAAEITGVFEAVYHVIEARALALAALPPDLDKAGLAAELKRIGDKIR